MKTKYQKLIVCILMLVMGALVLVGCQKEKTEKVSKNEIPKTNLSVPDFEEDLNLRIFADVPVAPTKKNLQNYKDAGFTHYTMTEDHVPLTNADGEFGTADDGVVNPEYTAALELCDELGLKVMIRNYRNDPYYFVNATDETRHYEWPFQSISYRIPVRNITDQLTKYPAVDGYYMTDEPSWSKIETLTPLADWYNANGGNTMFHLNLLQSYGSFMFDGHSFEEYVDHYCDVVLSKVNGTRTLSTDYYPLEKKADTGEAYIKDGYLFDYIVLARKVKELNEGVKDDTDKVLLNLYIQSYKANDKRDLSSVADIRFQMNVGLAFGMKCLNYYTYTGSEEGDGLVLRSGKLTKNYEWAKQANNEAHELADAILNFDWVGTKTYQGQQVKDETNAKAFQKIADKTADSFEFISDVTARLDTIVSEMEDKDGNKGYMIVNYSEPSLGLKDLVNVYFGKSVNKAVVYINGERKIVDVKQDALQLSLGAGEGAFVYPVYDAK